ncbi:MAG: hypothetical protein HON90_09595 [Halobacteriovoraceae bacterium]|nr:hypothetical protein [Halobacteriovoraceae bacterium]
MKNVLLFFIQLSLFISFYGCVDKISEEVKSSEKLSESDIEAQKFLNKSMRLVNKSAENLSHVLHKTGSLSVGCELQAPTLGFSSLTYDKTKASYTTDCIIDAQEYDLYFSGADFEVQVDEHLCEYVAYKPYRFFQYQPGKTTKEEFEVSCDSVCSEEASLSDICGKTYKSVTAAFYDPTETDYELAFTTGVTTAATINTYFSPIVPRNTYGNIVSPSNPILCEFDYSNTSYHQTSGPNCDEGKITTHNIQISAQEFGVCSDGVSANQSTCVAALEDWTVSLICDGVTAATRPVISIEEVTYGECGGKSYNCLAGPGNDELDHNKIGTIYQNVKLEKFSKSISISPPRDKGYSSNMYAANFSRVCSSNATKTTAQFDTTLNLILGHQIEDRPSRSAFTQYSYDENSDGINDYTTYGHHPFNSRGSSAYPTSSINPYYAILCLDKALDVKAQIRLHIREWNRDFNNTNAYLAKLSDINQSISLMDGIGDQAIGESWNDLRDWDDFLADIDMSGTSDLNANSSNADSLFTDNACQSLDIGYCSDRTYTYQSECEANSENWYLENYCSNSAFTDRTACEGGGATWIEIKNQDLRFYSPASRKNNLFPEHYL